jgi:hypothetical protein
MVHDLTIQHKDDTLRVTFYRIQALVEVLATSAKSGPAAACIWSPMSPQQLNMARA